MPIIPEGAAAVKRAGDETAPADAAPNADLPSPATNDTTPTTAEPDGAAGRVVHPDFAVLFEADRAYADALAAPVRAAAATLIARGFAVARVGRGEKSPHTPGWPTRSADPAEFGPGDQIGVIGGPLSNGGREGHAAVLLDLDDPRVVERADEFLPRTGMEDGRPGKPRSHRAFLVPLAGIPAEHLADPDLDSARAAVDAVGHPGPKTIAFRLPAGPDGKRGEALKVIGTGAQLVVPPSLWTSRDGARTERRAWTGGGPGEPAVVEFPRLLAGVTALAATVGASAAVPSSIAPAADGDDEGEPQEPAEPHVVRAAVEHLARCAPCVDGSGGDDQLFRVARDLVTGFGLSADEAFDAIAVDFNGRCVGPWPEKAVRRKLAEAERRPPRDKRPGYLLRGGKPVAAVVGPAPTAGDGGASPPRTGGGTAATGGTRAAPPDPFDPGMTLEALLKADIPAPQSVVEGVLPAGLTILAGRPKQGKSWLALLLAVVANGGAEARGWRPRGDRPVLHLALEDTRRRYRDRAAKVLGGLGAAAGSTLTVHTSWPRAGAGGLARLRAWFEANPGGLVIIDTLAKFRDPATGRGNSYGEDYAAVTDLKAIADKNDGAVLVVHHTRKSAAEDPFDEVSGTLGINGAADGLMVLDRRRGADAAAVYLTGRDVADQTLTIRWDETHGIWALADRAFGIERPQTAARKTSPGKVDGCADWLRTYLGEWAHPNDEILAAAKAAGYTFDNLKEAKARLGRETPGSAASPAGQGGVLDRGGAPPRPSRPRRKCGRRKTARTLIRCPTLPTLAVARDSQASASVGRVSPDSPHSPGLVGGGRGPETGQCGGDSGSPGGTTPH